MATNISFDKKVNLAPKTTTEQSAGQLLSNLIQTHPNSPSSRATTSSEGRTTNFSNKAPNQMDDPDANLRQMATNISFDKKVNLAPKTTTEQSAGQLLSNLIQTHPNSPSSRATTSSEGSKSRLGNFGKKLKKARMSIQLHEIGLNRKKKKPVVHSELSMRLLNIDQDLVNNEPSNVDDLFELGKNADTLLNSLDKFSPSNNHPDSEESSIDEPPDSLKFSGWNLDDLNITEPLQGSQSEPIQNINIKSDAPEKLSQSDEEFRNLVNEAMDNEYLPSVGQSQLIYMIKSAFIWDHIMRVSSESKFRNLGICLVCTMPIYTGLLETEIGNFHDEHFKCNHCNRLLTQDIYIWDADLLWCQVCFER
eukprot:TRINITY_DN10526_c0_g1_i1.p1 TRINITY_DN10526_c0_g1~~TRINITY_DN10526_c0_g1_i1.p1  ORF type:complete len:393 (+),score=72.87 TRINITY_DN10526_c0_g1_i1:88-1179(+)